MEEDSLFTQTPWSADFVLVVDNPPFFSDCVHVVTTLLNGAILLVPISFEDS